MRQKTRAESGFERFRKNTRREKFLGESWAFVQFWRLLTSMGRLR